MKSKIYEKDIEIIDEHHEAYGLWEGLRKSGYKNLTLLHIDSHSDLALPVLSESIYQDTNMVEEQLKIDTFIAPSLLQGTVNKVVFVNPRGIKKQFKKRFVGSIRGEGIILKFDVTNKHIFPDLKEWDYKITPNISSINGNVILDIDLDFFSCNLFVHPQFKLELTALQKSYVEKFNSSSHNSKSNLGFFNIKDKHLYFNQEFKDLVYNDDIKSIDFSIERLVFKLKAKPIFVDICRSVKSGYTPIKYADYIEKKLISTLCNPPIKEPIFDFTKFKIYPFVGWHDDIIFNPITNKFKKLTPLQYRVWGLILNKLSFEQIIERLRNENKNNLQLEESVYKAFLNLKDEMIIQ